jgi:hypothetical protein
MFAELSDDYPVHNILQIRNHLRRLDSLSFSLFSLDLPNSELPSHIEEPRR